MSIVRVASSDEVRPRHVAMAAIVIITLLAACLVTTGSGSVDVPDGGRAWREDSLFRAVVELFNLHYAQPTPLGVEVKSLIFGLGAAGALIAAALAVALRPRSDDEVQVGDTIVVEAAESVPAAPAPKKHDSALLAAQALALVYVLWSFAGILWSDAPDIALYGSIELALGFIWPFAIAYGLGRPGFRFCAYGLVAAAGATAAMAVLYVRERNPELRASYPIGNPISLAACLLPGLLIGLGVLIAQVRDFGNPRRVRRAWIAAISLGVLFMAAWAFRHADSRGAYAALAAGTAALVFFATSGKTRIIVLLLGLIGGALGVYLLVSRADRLHATGRDASLRERYYTWGYALELIARRKMLGHGQGGYTRKADALVAGSDVLEDPDALAHARVAHAHNEWLEIWTDLGSIGLVLAVGSLVLTLAAGTAALPTLPTLGQRWTMIALLASLVALAVEECAGVSLRIPGLPIVYYTVIGLIWAACTNRHPAPVRAIQANAVTRGSTVALALAAAAAAVYVSVTDFRAARAEYEVAGALNDLRWDDAVRQAEVAVSGRLNPHRRLVAQEKLSETYLHLARVHQANGLRRIQAALQTDPPEPQRLQLGQADIDAAESFRRRGMLVLGDLVRKAPDFYNSSWVEYQFEQIRAAFARARGDEDAARQFDQSSATALARELNRRPYDVNMAARLVVASGATLSVEKICEILARPLRYNPVPSLYYEIAARVLTVPAFMEKFAPIYQRIRDASPAQAVEDDPLAPEKLRLAAVIWFQEGEPDVAETALQLASVQYDALSPRFDYAAAACYAELADRRFFNHPTEPAPAMRDADEAIRRAPSSNEGRQLAAAVKHAKVAMLLAAGDEPAASALVRELRPDLPDAAIQNAVGERYAALAAAVMQRDSASYVDALRGWVVRSIELDPCNVPAWQQKADLAFRDERDAECVQCLREARRCGATTDFIYQFVDLALNRRPTSGPLLQYRDELAAEISGARVPPPTATAPIAPAPIVP